MKSEELLVCHAQHWTAVAQKVGACCGGVDAPVSDPNSTAGAIIAAIDAQCIRCTNKLVGVATDEAINFASENLRDAKRYRRLRVLGCALYGSQEIERGEVARFDNLDAEVDQDLRLHVCRGEAR